MKLTILYLKKFNQKFFIKKNFSELNDENCEKIDFYAANKQIIFQ